MTISKLSITAGDDITICNALTPKGWVFRVYQGFPPFHELIKDLETVAEWKPGFSQPGSIESRISKALEDTRNFLNDARKDPSTRHHMELTGMNNIDAFSFRLGYLSATKE